MHHNDSRSIPKLFKVTDALIWGGIVALDSNFFDASAFPRVFDKHLHLPVKAFGLNDKV